MGILAPRYDRLLVLAILASLTLHLVVAYFIPAVAEFARRGPAIETIIFTHVARISFEQRKAAPRRSHAAAPRRSTQLRVAHATPVERASGHNAQVKHSVKPTDVSAAAPAFGTTSVGNTSATAIASATPAATPTTDARQIASVEKQNEPGGYMPLGAEVPDPVLDPNARKALQSLGVHVTLIVTVGDDGRTKNIEFQPPLDAEMQSKIQALLADASWDPAVCGGGVPCEGRAVIKL